MWSIVSMLLIALAASTAGTAASGKSVWISPTGSDSGAGTKAAPWRTPQRALEYVASLRGPGGAASPLPSDVTVNVAYGTYLLSSPITLTPESGGDAGGSSVTFKGEDPGAHITFSGAALLEDVVHNADGTVAMRIPASVNCPGRCRRLFRMNPGGNGETVGSYGRELSRTPTLTYRSLSKRTMTVPEGQLANFSQADLAQAEAVVYHSWTSSLSPLQPGSGWDPATNTLSFAYDAVTACDGACFQQYYLQNLQGGSALQPGTFSVIDDSASGKGRYVLYRPFAGETVRPGDFGVGNLTTLLNVNAPAGARVANVAFDALWFQHTASDLSACLPSGCNAQSDADGLAAAIHLTDVSGVTFYNVSVQLTGHYGVWIDSGSSDVAVDFALLRHLGAGGVRIGSSSTAAQPERVSVADSVIQFTGEVEAAGPGVLVQNAAFVNITHNDIGPVSYTAVSSGWTWGYSPTTVRAVRITFNDLHDVFSGKLSDGGCVYTLGAQPGTLVDNNQCWNVHSRGYGGWGYYTDEGSSDITFTNNLATVTKSAGVHQHYGLDNRFENNILAFPGAWPCDDAPNCDNAGIRSSVAGPGNGKYSLSSFSFVRNVVLLNQPFSAPFFTVAKTGLAHDTFASNVYWSTTNKTDLPFGPSQSPVSFAQWQQSGKDVHSVVADPLFGNPAERDFRLAPDSPALKLGFQQIDFSTNGPRRMEERRPRDA
ncbi:hypothetical protein FNF29_00888 [Cafeteria roenbergensis]|uniref:Uncharacterized protein n=1 Tax=Cafeteria roenbergensis TaxID=33653 RepID=A0A5A8CWJ0_CAFRO|nr:hypothetical protein FNF29_00888 [Cafeteria roenbergensis]|eukprot:KAA0156777.1 hypothetical protein FNF29_00888 [Cafeteria roenbergensis]